MIKWTWNLLEKARSTPDISTVSPLVKEQRSYLPKRCCSPCPLPVLGVVRPCLRCGCYYACLCGLSPWLQTRRPSLQEAVRGLLLPDTVAVRRLSFQNTIRKLSDPDIARRSSLPTNIESPLVNFIYD